MVHEIHLEKKMYNKWRPSYVRNQSNFANRIEYFRERWSNTQTPAQRKAVIMNFNKEYSSWLKKVHAEHLKRRREESEFFEKIRQAKRQGPGAEERVISQYNKKSPKVSKSAPPPRSGGKRNTTNLRKYMAARNLAQIRKNLMAEKRNLEAKRNNLERQINSIINRIRELPF